MVIKNAPANAGEMTALQANTDAVNAGFTFLRKNLAPQMFYDRKAFNVHTEWW